MKYSEFYNKYDKKDYVKKSFKNKHGERFYVIRTDTVPAIYFITGDEYDWEVTRLFNPVFDVYTDEELRELSKCLKELVK